MLRTIVSTYIAYRFALGGLKALIFCLVGIIMLVTYPHLASLGNVDMMGLINEYIINTESVLEATRQCLSSVDPTTKTYLYGYIVEVYFLNEKFFGLLTSLANFSDRFNIASADDIHVLHLRLRELGNEIIEVVRLIEVSLNMDDGARLARQLCE